MPAGVQILAVADERELCVRNLRHNRRPCADEDVLPLRPRQPADADYERAAVEVEPSPCLLRVAPVGMCEAVDVDAVWDHAVARLDAVAKAALALGLADGHERVRPARREPLPADDEAADIPSAASNDQPCGWKMVGMRPRRSNRPHSPALEEWRWTTSGRAAARIVRRPRISAGVGSSDDESPPTERPRARHEGALAQFGVGLGGDRHAPAAAALVGDEVAGAFPDSAFAGVGHVEDADGCAGLVASQTYRRSVFVLRQLGERQPSAAPRQFGRRRSWSFDTGTAPARSRL